MRLIGMLDSPFVRRVAISLQLLDLPFTHEPLSVFSTFDAFRDINPVVKAPTLVTDEGEVLMDSTLILDYAQHAAGVSRRLMPVDPDARRRALASIGLALAACEKSVQLHYEYQLRPAERRHAPWIDRVTGQLKSAYRGLEQRLTDFPPAVTSDAIDQTGISAAVAWYFTQAMLPGVVEAAGFPTLTALSGAAEQLAVFRAAAYGDGVCRPGQ